MIRATLIPSVPYQTADIAPYLKARGQPSQAPDALVKKSAGLEIDDPSNKDEFLTKAPGVKIRRPFTQKL